MFQEYYEKQLYPLQNRVLAAIDSIPSKFYLTGGTAVSRSFFQHRYSDDLDFFMNREKDFEQQTAYIFDFLKTNFDSVEITLAYESFARCFVSENEVKLKVEFVNDVPFRVGSPQMGSLFSRTDNLDNILSNKISALSRNEAKDIADIWQITLGHDFNWQQAIENAKNKDMWVNESEVLLILEQFELERLNTVRWTKPLDLEKAQKDREIILYDVLWGKDNSLYKKNT